MGLSYRAACAALLCALASADAAAIVRADYQFQSTLASSVGGAPALTDLGAGNAFVVETVDATSRTVLSFPLGNGLSLSPTTAVIANNTYSVVMLVRMADVAGYNKYFDVKNGTSDGGLYVSDGVLEFYPNPTVGTTPITAGSYAQIAITRDLVGNVIGYVNGVQQFTFLDTPGDGIIDAANTLRFFLDDAATSGGEASAGAVARIRVFDNVLTPAEVAALDRLPSGQTAVIAVPANSITALLALALLLGLGTAVVLRSR